MTLDEQQSGNEDDEEEQWPPKRGSQAFPAIIPLRDLERDRLSLHRFCIHLNRDRHRNIAALAIPCIGSILVPANIADS